MNNKPRPEIHKNYSDSNGLKVQVHAICFSHVVVRKHPLNEMDIITRSGFNERFLSE